MRALKFLLACFLILSSCSSTSKKKDYLIGVDPSWYPLELAGREKNALAFSIELLREIAKKDKLLLSLVRMNWDNLIQGLDEKKYVAALSTLPPYLFYEKKYSFSDLYLMTGPVLVVPIRSKKTSLTEMQGKEIAVVAQSKAEILLQPYQGILLRAYGSAPEALNALAREEVDGAVIDLLLAQGYVNDLYQGQLKISSPPLNADGLRLVTLFDANPKLLERFNTGLAALKESGEYEKLQKKWGLLSSQSTSDAKLNAQIEALIQSIF